MAHRESDGAPATILVVDDEARNLEVISEFLTAVGFGVVTAEDGETALALVEANAPDVILLDVVMPGLGGFDVCRRLKADAATVFIPVILITALSGTEDRIKGAAAGADDFLTKPFDYLELVTRVKSLVRVKWLHDQLETHNRELETRVAERTAELQAALDQVRELDRLKSEFIANVSHELRTPLLHVKGYLSLIAEGALGTFSPEQTKGIAIAQRAVDHLERVVQDIVDFRDLHSRELDLTPVHVADLCRRVIEMLAPAARQRQVTVTLAIPPDLPPILADRAAITRVMQHLVDNAVKFSPANGLVKLMAERHKDRVRIAVRDQGPGIPPDKRDQIFDMFVQGDGSTTRQAGGMGLGLALVKRLLEAHLSQVNIASEVGRGSTFYFDLPAAGDFNPPK